MNVDLKWAVLRIWKTDQAVAMICVARDAKIWGMLSLRSATIDIPRTQNWKVMKTMSSRLVLSSLDFDQQGRGTLVL